MSSEFDSLLSEAARSYDRIRSSRFQRVEELGRGGMSMVYRAVDRKLGREVAIKCLRLDVESDPEAAVRFQREARVSAGIRHPNVVTVFDACEDAGRMVIVMECVDGRPLSAILGARTTEMRRLLQMLEKAARGVAAAHAGGVVHRDLKPANILVTDDDEPKVVDFGLALVLDFDTTRITQAGTSMGTPSYMAPEQAEGRARDISVRTDVYGLGAILYEILTGRPPYTGDTAREVLTRIGVEDPIRPRRLNRQAPPEVEAICLKALERDPARRYADAAEFADDLKNHLEGRPIRAKIAGPLSVAFRWMRRHLAVTGVAAAVLIALGAWGTYRAVRSARIGSLLAKAESARYPEERAKLLEEAMRLAPEDAAIRLRWERARKRADAFRLVAEAENLEKERETVERECHALESALEGLEKKTNRWQPEKPEIWTLRARLLSLRHRAAELEAGVVGAYTRAAGLDPDYAAPRKFLAEWHWDKFLDSEREGDAAEAATQLSYVRQYDLGRYGPRIDAPGTLAVESDPPGARITLWTFETADDGRLVAANPREPSPTLPPGSYLLTLTLEGHVEARYPIHVQRGTDHRVSVSLVRSVPPGFVFVPGGDGVKSFFIARNETTWDEFVAYLNDVLGDRAPERMRAMPKSAAPDWREEAGRIVITGRGDHPACGVTWHEATEYCAWRSKRDGVTIRLPEVREWDRAARGADGRRFPWGNSFDWSFTNGARSRRTGPGPAAVGTFAKDESVFGVCDMGGNAEEWCAGAYDAELDLKHVRGGGWDDPGEDDFELGSDGGDKPFIVEHSKGFRVVQSR